MAKKKPTDPEKRGPGRPATGRKRRVRVSFWMTEKEREVLESAALHAGLPLTRWGMETLLACAISPRAE